MKILNVDGKKYAYPDDTNSVTIYRIDKVEFDEKGNLWPHCITQEIRTDLYKVGDNRWDY